MSFFKLIQLVVAEKKMLSE